MDRIIRATAGDGMIKMAVIEARDLVQRAREIHNCTPTAAAALGRTLCGASLLGEAMKEENASLTIRINGGGPIGSVVAVSDHEGCVRGYVENPLVDLPLRADGTPVPSKPEVDMKVSGSHITLTSTHKIYDVSVYDVNGKRLHSQEGTQPIDISSLPHGVFLINAEMDNGFVEVHKILK